MGNNQIDKTLKYNQGYGYHKQNISKGTITKYYHLSSQAELKSLKILINKYQSRQIPTIIPLVKSQSYNNEDQEYGWSLQFNYYQNNLQNQLKIRKNQNKFYEEKQIVYLIDCVLSGLLSLSTERLYHGNVRPSSIFIGSKYCESIRADKKIYLISLPLLTNYQTLQKDQNSSANSLYYLSPEYFEQIQQGHKKPKSYQFNDIFSLGMILLQAVTLCDISELYDCQKLRIDFEKVRQKLYNCHLRYSEDLCNLISHLLEEYISSRYKFYDAYQELNKILLKLNGNVKNDSSLNLHFSPQSKQISSKKVQGDNYDKFYRHKVESQTLKSSILKSKVSQNAWKKFIDNDHQISMF